jgi:hypothetical protein
LLFREQTAECVSESISWFERHAAEFDPQAARRQALHFNPRRFDAEFDRFVQALDAPITRPERRAA